MSTGLPGLQPGLTQALTDMRQERAAAAERRRTTMSGLAETFGLPLQLVQPLLEIQNRRADRDESQPNCFLVTNAARGPLSNDLLKRVGPRADRLVDLQREQVVDTAHHSLLAFARVAARYVAGALFLAALQQLQRKAGLRRAAAIPRPSDATTTGGAR